MLLLVFRSLYTLETDWFQSFIESFERVMFWRYFRNKIIINNYIYFFVGFDETLLLILKSRRPKSDKMYTGWLLKTKIKKKTYELWVQIYLFIVFYFVFIFYFLYIFAFCSITDFNKKKSIFFVKRNISNSLVIYIYICNFTLFRIKKKRRKEM